MNKNDALAKVSGYILKKRYDAANEWSRCVANSYDESASIEMRIIDAKVEAYDELIAFVESLMKEE